MTSEIVGEGLLRQFAAWSEHSAWLLFWSAVSFLGSGRFFTLLLPVVFALQRPPRAMRFASTVLGGAFAAELLKALFARPRLDPMLLGARGPLEDPGLFDNEAFPSGHVLMAVLIWGDLLLRRSPRARVGAVLLMLSIGMSRLALLRHDLLDVLGGFALGALLLMALWRSEAWIRRLAGLPWPQLAALWLAGGAAALAGLPRVSMAVVLGVWAGAGAAAAWQAAHPIPTRPKAWRIASVFLAVTAAILCREFLSRWEHSLLATAAGYALLGALVAGPIPRLRSPARGYGG